MKKIFFAMMLLSCRAFADDYNQIITKQVCACGSKIDSTLDQESIYLQFGVCLLNASKPYAKEIKKDYKIDLSNFNEDTGEKLGNIFGIKIAAECPQLLLLLSNKKETTGAPVVEVNSAKGKITNIEESQFITIYIEDNNGKTGKYLWLTFFPTSKEILNNPKSLLNKHVVVEYTEEELLDPRIKEYIKYKIIKNISIEQ